MMYEFFERGVNALESIAKSLNDSNFTAWGIFIASMATVGVGVGSLLLSRKQIRDSEERQYNEQFERIRPWIVIDGPVPVQVEYENRGAISWEEFRKSTGSEIPPSSVKIGMRFTNTGIRPAKNLKQIAFRQYITTTRQELEKLPEQDMHLDIGPNQSQYYLFKIPWGEWNQLIETPIFLGLRISYDNGRTRSYSGGVYKFAKAQWELITSWYN